MANLRSYSAGSSVTSCAAVEKSASRFPDRICLPGCSSDVTNRTEGTG
jgi:hypothetical protein